MTTSNLEQIILKHSGSFHPVIKPGIDEKVLPVSLSEESLPFSLELIANTGAFSKEMEALRNSMGAKFLFGGYNENRSLYKRSGLFNRDEEPRSLHLGIDIWGDAGTKIYNPLPATVHSFGFNNNFGDYGATIILQHTLEGIIFHTLFGHLSLSSLDDLQEGKEIEKGRGFAEFGIPSENGDWPPHLHFQVIENMGDWKGDYPGVCRPGEALDYLQNCPDPAPFIRF